MYVTMKFERKTEKKKKKKKKKKILTFSSAGGPVDAGQPAQQPASTLADGAQDGGGAVPASEPPDTSFAPSISDVSATSAATSVRTVPGVNQADTNTAVVDDATDATDDVAVTTTLSRSPGSTSVSGAASMSATLPDVSTSTTSNLANNNNNNNASVTPGPGDGSIDQLTIIAAAVAGGVALIALVICVSCSIFYARRDRKKDLTTIARGSAARSSTRTSTSSSTPTPTSGKQVSRNGTVIGTHELLAAGTGASTVSATEYDHVPSELGSNGQMHGQGNYAVLNRQKTGVANGYEGAKMLEQANAQNDLQAHGYGGARVLQQANEAPYKQLTLSGTGTAALPTLEL
jgi:hypothetical protein